MPRLFELALNVFVPVELAIGDELAAAIFARDGLTTAGEVDDAEARMPEPHASIGRHPMPLPIRTAMKQAPSGPLQPLLRDRSALREDSNDSTHMPRSTSGSSPPFPRDGILG